MKYIKMIVASMVLFVATFSFANAKDDLTILNTGSKTGGFSQQSLAYYTDLSRMKKDFGVVNLVNPGNKCIAIKSLLKSVKGPILFPWGSDLEAKQRVGRCDATVDISNASIVRFVEKYQAVCQLNSKMDVRKNSGKFGINAGTQIIQGRTVDAINKSFKTKHRSVAYDGWGASKVALLNGEIDYMIVSPPGDQQVKDEGGLCEYDLSRSENSLYSLDKSNIQLVSSNIDVWLAWNMTDEQAKDLAKKLKTLHYECDTAISKWQKGCDKEGTAIHYSEFDIDESHLVRWEDSVRRNTIDE